MLFFFNKLLSDIPHFKEVVIMATNCESCGHRTNEVKSGGGMEPRGVRIEVAIAGKEDFSRDILKSENCSLEIPELDMDVGGRALGGRFTTVEGLIVAAKEQLSSSPFTGDSSDVGTAKRMDEFMKKMDVIVSGDEKFTLILDDPTGNSYVQSLSDDGQDDKLKITRYERTFEQNEELGLNDMKVDNY